jgi:hypothetical protein
LPLPSHTAERSVSATPEAQAHARPWFPSVKAAATDGKDAWQVRLEQAERVQSAAKARKAAARKLSGPVLGLD